MGNTLTAGHASWHDTNVHGSDHKSLPPEPGNNCHPQSTTRSISKASAPYDAESPTEVEGPGLGTRRGQPLSLSLPALRNPDGGALRREDGTTQTTTTTVTVTGGINSSMRNLSHGDLPPARDSSLSNAAMYGSSTSCTFTGGELSMEIVVDASHAPSRPTARLATGSELATKMSNAQHPGSAKMKEMQRVNSLMHIMDRKDQKQLSGSKTVLFTTAVREKRRRSKLGSSSPNSRTSSARTSVETVASAAYSSSSASQNNDDRSVGHDAASEPFYRSASFHAAGIHDRRPACERDTEPVPRRRGSVAKSNSCSTLFVDSTLNKADLHGTLHCIATALLASIQKNHELASIKTNDIFSELLHPLLEDRPLSRPDRMPTEDEIYNFLESLFDAASLNAECAIITLIYIERMLSYSDITLHACNWARVLLGGLLLACKVWDDQAVWNADFCKIFPAVQVSDMNRLERWYICAIQHNVSIKASLYAKYYFELRDVAERSHRRFELRPLSIREAQRLETRSRIMTVAQSSQKSVVDTPSEHEGMRRAMSDNLFVPNTPATLM